MSATILLANSTTLGRTTTNVVTAERSNAHIFWDDLTPRETDDIALTAARRSLPRKSPSPARQAHRNHNHSKDRHSGFTADPAGAAKDTRRRAVR